MFKTLFKIALALVFIFLLYLAGVQALNYFGIDNSQLTEIGDNISGKVQLEQKKIVDKNLAVIKCQELCQFELSAGSADFNTGPCLAETIIPDWSCDIAHAPRQAVDDDPANQCGSFRQGVTHHFVELDGNCNRIQVYWFLIAKS